MRLIDADALDSVLEDFERRYKKSFFKISANAIKLTRTIVFAMRTADAVSRGVHEQVRWERDVAIEQLESYGVSLGEKADVVKVVRCKDCKHFVQGEPYDPCECMKWKVKWGAVYTTPDGYCHKGERKDNG